MEYDCDKVDEMVLALLWLTLGRPTIHETKVLQWEFFRGGVV
jgi:hypothetical protein